MKPKNDKKFEIECLHCKGHFSILKSQSPPAFCVLCGNSLSQHEDLSSESIGEDVTLVQGHAPKEQAIQFAIGSYQVLNHIGKGGMGEVLLAYDTVCGRRIALKRIRPDLITLKQIKSRFLKEARVTCQLTHPAIIPIYSIHKEKNLAYYTMPFVEGETLKQIFRKTRLQEKRGEKLDHIGGSIPALIRIFITICQAVGYAHSKGVLHRDLKPENIILGRYGEVMILDWGLAKLLNADEEPPILSSDDFQRKKTLNHLTRLGKVVGTVTYMAPERARGNPATIQTDIYSLGVILYQILTLKLPFRRGSLKEFREKIHAETLIDPIEVAPYRDVPKILSTIAIKCLSANPHLRYQSVDELIRDLENYIEGRTEWFQIAELNILNKNDWEFQENILIAEHTAITRNAEVSEWVSLMIAKASFAENIKIEAKVFLGSTGHGIGFLLNVPEASERKHINDGYCLWIGSDINKTTKLLKSSHEVLQAEEVFLQRNEWYRIKIEKVENTIHFYLNDILQFSYISRMPMVGTHIGLLNRDADFLVEGLSVYVGSQNIMVNCLAIPDAFLAHKDYQTALSEYRRIGYAFPGRAEGREATLRAGITLLEQAKNTSDPMESLHLFDSSLNEFEKLHRTAGAPLEYLGKALVYQAMRDNEEEIKCFELACRRYPNHPLLHVLEEQAIFRMQESSRTDRKATYSFLLLTLRFISRFQSSNPVQKLLMSLKKHWETLPFLFEDSKLDRAHNASLSIPLAFWLDKVYILEEIARELIALENKPVASIGNTLFSLRALGHSEISQKLYEAFEKEQPGILASLKPMLYANNENLSLSLKLLKLEENIDEDKLRSLEFLLDMALDLKQADLVLATLQKLPSLSSSLSYKKIWAELLNHNWQAAGELLHSYPFELLSKENSLLFFLYGCWLFATEGREIANVHFAGVLDAPYPRTFALGSHYLIGKLADSWHQQAFAWEKIQLQRQLNLFDSVS